MDDRKFQIRQLTGNVSDFSRAQKDSEALVAQFPSLHPRQEYFTTDDGRNQPCLCFSGTVPVAYRGATYNIPVSVFVPPQYPRQPPAGFVTPTANMVLKPSYYVSDRGRFINHPVITNWPNAKKDSQTVVALVHAMQGVFAQEPPVYSRPPSGQQPSPQQQQAPPPYNSTAYSDSSQQSANGYYPYGATNGNPYGSGVTSTTTTSTSSSHFQYPYGRPPQNLYTNGRPQTTGYYASNNSPSPNSQSMYPSPPIGSLTMPQPMIMPQSVPTTLPPVSASGTLRPSSQNSRNSSPMRPTSPQEEEEITLMSLKSALKEKADRYLNGLNADASAETNRQLEVNQKLMDSEAQLKRLADGMKSEKERLESSIRQLREKIAEYQRWNESKAREPELPADAIIIPPHVIHRQLFDLVADDQAIDDTLYYLGKALHASKIDLQQYMKLVRQLSAEQFMNRALVTKIRKLLGLVPANEV